MAVNGLKVLASFLFHPACYKKENIPSCNIYSYKLVSKNGLGWALWFPEWVLRKKMETYWSRGNAPTLFLVVYILHQSEHCWIREGYITGVAKPQGAGQKRGEERKKRKRPLVISVVPHFVCLSVICEKTLHIFKEYHFLQSFKDVWKLSLGSGLQPQPQMDGNVLLLPKIIGSDQITDILPAHN